MICFVLQRSNDIGGGFGFADYFFAHIPMMMSLLGPGSLDLMSSMSMKGSFAVLPGHQVLSYPRSFFI